MLYRNSNNELTANPISGFVDVPLYLDKYGKYTRNPNAIGAVKTDKTVRVFKQNKPAEAPVKQPVTEYARFRADMYKLVYNIPDVEQDEATYTPITVKTGFEFSRDMLEAHVYLDAWKEFLKDYAAHHGFNSYNEYRVYMDEHHPQKFPKTEYITYEVKKVKYPQAYKTAETKTGVKYCISYFDHSVVNVPEIIKADATLVDDMTYRRWEYKNSTESAMSDIPGMCDALILGSEVGNATKILKGKTSADVDVKFCLDRCIDQYKDRNRDCKLKNSTVYKAFDGFFCAWADSLERIEITDSKGRFLKYEYESKFTKHEEPAKTDKERKGRRKWMYIHNIFKNLRYEYNRYNMVVNNKHKISYILVPCDILHSELIRKDYPYYNENAIIIVCYKKTGIFEFLTMDEYKWYIQSGGNKSSVLPYMEDLDTDGNLYQSIRLIENFLDTHDIMDVNFHSKLYSFEYEQFKMNRIFSDDQDDYYSEDFEDSDAGFTKSRGKVSEKENATYHRGKRISYGQYQHLINMLTIDINKYCSDKDIEFPKFWEGRNDRKDGLCNRIITHPTLNLLKNPDIKVGDCGRKFRLIDSEHLIYACPCYNYYIADAELNVSEPYRADRWRFANGKLGYTCPACGKFHYLEDTAVSAYHMEDPFFDVICTDCEALIRFVEDLEATPETLASGFVKSHWVGTDNDSEHPTYTLVLGGESEDNYN